MSFPGLDFAEPPPPRRTPSRIRLVRKDPPAPRRRSVTPPDYVAPDSHRPHGTRVKYVIERCRCEPCRTDNRHHARLRRRAMQRPDEAWVPYVPAAPVRAHIRMLMEAGLGPKRLAVVSGVPHGAISKIVYGDYVRGTRPSRRVRPETARKILAVQPTVENLGARQPVPAGPILALVDDLVARGWTKVWIAQQIVGPRARALQIAKGPKGMAGAATARKVRELHARLEGQRGPGRRSRWSR